ncbi:MAG: DNA polymerase III subunit gamma/tau [Planctomycetia bacterium]|nr:DNA polymerase III subunit gamma/tau [Planctomycetia bacterium]
MAAPEGKNSDSDFAPDESSTERSRQYVVVARRYRPQTFDELIGQEHVARALTNAITTNRVGHAYLFTGARGVGKTSAARILAKALDCQSGPTATPCNQCDMCQSISAGSDVDVLEIDGASNRGIDEIRQLRQNVNIRPSRARFKIYIIDEVHMLTREAFNALLKTLEEPPEHVKFIFCTTEPTKIPITILSRCQRFDFAGIQLPSIIERLKQIVAAEGVSADPEALAQLARRAGGSMRDSQSLLEQLLAFGEERITTTDVHTMLGTAADARLSELVAHLVERNAAAAISDLDAALSEGVDVGQLLEQLLGYFRDSMTAAVGCPADTFLHTSPAEHEQLVKAGQQLGLETILAIMQIVDQTLSRMRYSTQGRTLAEMALVRIANLEDLDELADLIAQMRSGTPREGAATRPGPGRSAVAVNPVSPAAKKKAELSTAQQHEPEVQTRSATHVQPLTSETVLAIWQEVLADFSGLLEENASRCESVAFRVPNRLVVTFQAKYTSCKAFCERPEVLSKIEAALAEATGTNVKIDFVLLEDETPSGLAARRPMAHRQRLAAKAEHPLVRRARELFDAQLVRIEEPGD